MVVEPEYDWAVKARIPASVAAFGAAAVLVLACITAQGQVNGTPPSVTSIGFGGHYNQPPGVGPSVTSPGPRGYTPNQPFCCYSGNAPATNSGHGDHHPRHTGALPVGGAVYAVPYPVYIVNPQDPEDDSDAAPAENSPPGPTIFDRRGSEQSSQAFEAQYALRAQPRPAEPAQQPEAAPEAAPAQPPTVLLFKDGHQLEVQNYAIVGSTLYDLTPGHRGRVAVSDLDLPATAKANDDRGIDFQLPATTDKN